MPTKYDKREYRRIDIEQMETRAAEDGKMIVEGYATTFNQPYRLMGDDKITVMEQVDSRAFDETDMTDVILQYDHEGPVYARMSNGTLTVEADDHGLKVTANLGGTERGRQLFEEIDGGYSTKMSIGFTVKEDRKERRKEADGKILIMRTLTRIQKLFDVSVVSVPANDATEISSRMVSDGLIAEATEEIRAEEERQQRIGEIRKLLKGDQNNDE